MLIAVAFSPVPFQNDQNVENAIAMLFLCMFFYGIYANISIITALEEVTAQFKNGFSDLLALIFFCAFFACLHFSLLSHLLVFFNKTFFEKSGIALSFK